MNRIDWAWLSCDGATTKAPLSGQKKTGKNPTDRGKQGVKRSLLTDAQGMPLAVTIAGANRHDSQLLFPTLQALQVSCTRPVKTHICLDKADDAQWIRQDLKDLYSIEPHIQSRGAEKKAKQTSGKKARRWVVERTHSGLNRFRRLQVRWEKKAENYLGLLHFACGFIVWKNLMR